MDSNENDNEKSQQNSTEKIVQPLENPNNSARVEKETLETSKKQPIKFHHQKVLFKSLNGAKDSAEEEEEAFIIKSDDGQIAEDKANNPRTLSSKQKSPSPLADGVIVTTKSFSATVDDVNWLSFISFTWIFPWMWQAYKCSRQKDGQGQFFVADPANTAQWTCSIFDSANVNLKRLEHLWTEELNTSRAIGRPPSLFRALLRFLRFRLALACFVFLFCIVFGRYVEISRVLAYGATWAISYRTAIRTRGAVLALLYKTLLNAKSMRDKSSAEIMNMFANDGQRLFDAVTFAPLVLIGPFVLIGAKDVFLFERNLIGAHNATRVSIGQLTSPMFYSDPSMRAVVRKSFEIYNELAKDGAFNFSRCGRVYLAASDEMAINARRLYTRLCTDPSISSECELVDCPGEMLSRWPMLATEDLKLAVISPLDATIDVMGLCRLLTDHCKEMGVQVHENCSVKKVLLNEESRVYAVDTDEGFIDANTFVNAAGIWASLVEVLDLAPDNHLHIAAHPCSYTFLSTEPLSNSQTAIGGNAKNCPVFICLDENTYICPTEFRTICGGFVEGDLQSLTLPAQTRGRNPEWTMPAANWDKFRTVLRHLINRCPELAKLNRGDLITSPEMYTPDSRPLIGESDQAHGYFIANGMNAQGLSFAGGLGSILADWILAGQPGPSISVDKLDVARFLPLHSNPQYLYQRVPEVASNIFKTLTPTHQCHTARNLRTSPIHHYLRDAGAVFAENMGYERPLWYNPPLHHHHHQSDQPSAEMPRQTLFTSQDPLCGKPSWFPLVAKEYQTCRERVGLIDMTSFSKFDLDGPDAIPLLQRLCSANIDRPVGTTIYTGMQNDWGGYVTDLTVSRIGQHNYFLVAPTVQQVRLAIWIRRWAKEWGMDIRLQDVTNNFTALDIVGPASRDLMKEVTGKSMSTTEFPSFAFRQMQIGLAGPIRVVSVTHCGELGWMLYIQNELAQNVYEQLIEAGSLHGLKHCGYYALRHLRIEKFYVYWGQDIDSNTTPVECGRVFRVDFDKEFIGKEALQRQMERGVNKRFVQLLVDRHDLDNDPWPQGEEPIYRNNKLIGWTTTAAYGFTLGCHVCLGYVENNSGGGVGLTPEYLSHGQYEVELAGRKFPCRINLNSPRLPMVSSEHPHHYRPTQ